MAEAIARARFIPLAPRKVRLVADQIRGKKVDEARATLAELAKRFATYDAGVSAILQNMQRLTIAKQSARAINVEAEPLLNDTVKLSQLYEGGAGFARTFTLWAAIVFAILALVCLVLLGKVFLEIATIAQARERIKACQTRELFLHSLGRDQG